jgi:hypothetical protein
MLFLSSIPRVMPPTVQFASARFSFPPVVNGNLEDLSSLVILPMRILSLLYVFLPLVLSMLHYIKVSRLMPGI